MISGLGNVRFVKIVRILASNGIKLSGAYHIKYNVNFDKRITGFLEYSRIMYDFKLSSS